MQTYTPRGILQWERVPFSCSVAHVHWVPCCCLSSTTLQVGDWEQPYARIAFASRKKVARCPHDVFITWGFTTRCNASSLCHITEQNCSGGHKYAFSDKYCLGSVPTPYWRVSLNIGPSVGFPYHFNIGPLGFLFKDRMRWQQAVSTAWREHPMVKIRQ